MGNIFSYIFKNKWDNEEVLYFGLLEDNTDAWTYLYKNYKNKIIKYIKKHGINSIEAEDIFQDIVLIFNENIRNNKFLPPYKIKSFFYQCALNLNIQYYRKNKKNRLLSFETNNYFHNHYINEDELEVSQFLESKFKIIEDEIKKLDEKCRKFIKYKFYDNLSNSAIAEKLNSTVSTINNLGGNKGICIQKILNSLIDG